MFMYGNDNQTIQAQAIQNSLIENATIRLDKIIARNKGLRAPKDLLAGIETIQKGIERLKNVTNAMVLIKLRTTDGFEAARYAAGFNDQAEFETQTINL
jgi:hypothetical protein